MVTEIPDVTWVGCYKLTTVPTCFSCEFLPASVVSAYPFQLRVPTCFSCKSRRISVASPYPFHLQVPTCFCHKSLPVSVASPYQFQLRVPTSFSCESLPVSVVSPYLFPLRVPTCFRCESLPVSVASPYLFQLWVPPLPSLLNQISVPECLLQCGFLSTETVGTFGDGSPSPRPLSHSSLFTPIYLFKKSSSILQVLPVNPGAFVLHHLDVDPGGDLLQGLLFQLKTLRMVLPLDIIIKSLPSTPTLSACLFFPAGRSNTRHHH